VGNTAPLVAHTQSTSVPLTRTTAPQADLDANVAKIPEPAQLSLNPEETRKRVQEAIDRLNEQLSSSGVKLGFQIDGEIDRQIVRVYHKDSGELVRQIPHEVVIRVAHSIEDLRGLLFDGRS
jgi:flagellar protein FlaG